MRLTLLHRDQEWLYSVYCSDDQSHYVLEAIFPGVGWDDIVIRLTSDEATLFKDDKQQFLQFVNRILKDRSTERVAARRIKVTTISDTEIAV